MSNITKIYHNGNILTVNNDNEVVEAIALDKGKIVAVGSDKEILDLAKSDTKVINLENKTMIPGFFDIHSHFYLTGLYSETEANLNSPSIGKVKSIQEIIEVLKDWSKNIPEGNLIKGQGYDDTALLENRRITKYDLDKVSTKHPIIIRHISGHLYATNSLGLEILGITEETPDPSDAIFCKDPKTGEHNGVIEEGLDLINPLLEETSAEDEIKSIKKANDIYSSVGVTTASTGSTRVFNEIELIKSGQEKGDVKIRVILNKVERLIDELDGYKGFNDMFLEGSGKTFQDGSIQGYSGYLSKPYYKHEDLTFNGYPTRPLDKLVDIVEKFHTRGEQIFIHCNGDQAIEDVIDAIEIVQKKHPRQDARHVAIHAQMAREDQLDS